MHNDDASGPAATDSLLAMLQTLRQAPGGTALLAEIENGRKVRGALGSLVERAFVAFLKNVSDRYARTAPCDAATRLKLKTIAQRLGAHIDALAVRQPAPELRDATALEQHLVALLWAVRQPAAHASGGTSSTRGAEAKLKPLQDTLAQLDKAVHANLDSIASLGSIEQTLKRAAPGELEEWRQILRDATREVIDDYRRLGENLQHARASCKEIARQSPAGTAAATPGDGAVDRELLLQRLNAEMRRAQRYRQPLSLALLGPDRIEDIRHLVGAEAARAILRYYLENVASCARAYDTVASCKPHKLVWVLPGADTDQGVCALRKAQERITAAHYHYAGRRRPLPTFSAAVVGYTPGEESGHLLARAETLVAFAKQAGPSHIEWEKRRLAVVPRVR